MDLLWLSDMHSFCGGLALCLTFLKRCKAIFYLLLWDLQLKFLTFCNNHSSLLLLFHESWWVTHHDGKDGGNPLALHTASHSLFNTGLVSRLWSNFSDFELRLSANLSDYLFELDTGAQSCWSVISRSTYLRRSVGRNHLINGIHPLPRCDLRRRHLPLLKSSARSSQLLLTNSRCRQGVASHGSVGLVFHELFASDP